MAIIAVVVAAATTVGAPPAHAATPTVTVTPSSGLVDFQRVQVTGSGFEPDALLEVYECRGGAVDEADCDAGNSDFVDVDSSGNVIPYGMWVDARIYLPDGTEVDCRTDPRGCEIGVGFLVDAGQWPAAPLAFDQTAPLLPVVSATVTPSTDLVDGQVVQVHGDHLSFREDAYAFVCAAGTTAVGNRCDLDHLARDVPAAGGSIDLPLTVHPQFDPPLGDPVDCATVTGGCVVLVSWGFSFVPDRSTTVPISFAAAVSTTTSTAPPAAPAAPVAGTAAFTG
ncbi:MAG: neocarzinostatin apoprotein domain-containing protein [Acidimicrobiales bacterium]